MNLQAHPFLVGKTSRHPVFPGDQQFSLFLRVLDAANDRPEQRGGDAAWSAGNKSAYPTHTAGAW